MQPINLEGDGSLLEKTSEAVIVRTVTHDEEIPDTDASDEEMVDAREREAEV